MILYYVPLLESRGHNGQRRISGTMLGSFALLIYDLVRRIAMIVKITSKRQVTFPARVLDALGVGPGDQLELQESCLLYTSPSPRDRTRSRMPSSA